MLWKRYNISAKITDKKLSVNYLPGGNEFFCEKLNL